MDFDKPREQGLSNMPLGIDPQLLESLLVQPCLGLIWQMITSRPELPHNPETAVRDKQF